MSKYGIKCVGIWTVFATLAYKKKGEQKCDA